MPISRPWPLRTARLSLRPYRAEDLEWLTSLYGRPEVARFLLDEPWTPQQARDKLAKRMKDNALDGPSGALSLAIDRGDDPIGDVSVWFTDRERRVAEMGWVLNPEHSGYGYAREAVRAVIRHVFDDHALHRLVAQMDARNEASAHLASSVGMRREAHHLQDYWSKGEWTDSLVFALLSTDPR